MAQLAAPARSLTVAQRERLDTIARQDPSAKVVGWRAAVDGPILRRGDGRLQALTPLGRTNAIGQSPR